MKSENNVVDMQYAIIMSCWIIIVSYLFTVLTCWCIASPYTVSIDRN